MSKGKIISGRVNRLTSKQQRLMTNAIKRARILSLLPFLYNENKFDPWEISLLLNQIGAGISVR